MLSLCSSRDGYIYRRSPEGGTGITIIQSMPLSGALFELAIEGVLQQNRHINENETLHPMIIAVQVRNQSTIMLFTQPIWTCRSSGFAVHFGFTSENSHYNIVQEITRQSISCCTRYSILSCKYGSPRNAVPFGERSCLM